MLQCPDGLVPRLFIQCVYHFQYTESESESGLGLGPKLYMV